MREPHERAPDPAATPAADRRDFLASAATLAMAAGLCAGYGAAAVIAGRYLYPAKPRALEWVFLATLAELRPGAALVFRAPTGERITVARRGPGRAPEDFVALSSTCPHLGCQVHWEPQNTRFFCPCHNGVFDPSGRATGGPPAEAGQSLPRYALEVRGELLYIQVPTESLASPSGERVAALSIEVTPERGAPGHDPCLSARAPRTA
jgi:cytochrome b6-f complex iron-sulfur subunit